MLGKPSIERLRNIIWLWLPLDEERDWRARVWLAFTATAATDADLAVKAAGLDAELKTWFTEQLADLQRDRGHAKSELDPSDTAAQLLALIDGTTVHCLMLPMKERPALAERTLRMWLDNLNLF